MNNEKAIARKKMVEARNRNKSVDHRMIYPTATNFDDLFHGALPTSEDCPNSWIRQWVFDDPEDENRVNLAAATINPFCRIEDGTNLWVHPRDHLVETVKEKMVGIPGDELYFDIIYKGNRAIISIRHHSIVGRKLLAKIQWDSVPHQHSELTSPS